MTRIPEEQLPKVVRMANGTNGHGHDYAGADDFVESVGRTGGVSHFKLDAVRLAKETTISREAEIKGHLRALTYQEMVDLAKDFSRHLPKVVEDCQSAEEAKAKIEESMAASLNAWARAEPSEEPEDTPPPYARTEV